MLHELMLWPKACKLRMSKVSGKIYKKRIIRQYPRPVPLATTVNDKNTPDTIATMCKGHFDKLLNCVKNETNRQTVENAIHEISPDDNLTITPDMVG